MDTGEANPWNPLQRLTQGLCWHVAELHGKIKKPVRKDQVNLFESYAERKENQAALRLLFY